MRPSKNSRERLLDFCRAHDAWLVETIERLARLESPSLDKAAVDRCGRELAGCLASIGAAVLHEPRQQAGDIVIGDFGHGPRQILLLGHMDTVWPVGTLAGMPVERRGGRLYGPGVYDMKGGLAMAMLAARAVTAGEGAAGEGAVEDARLRLLVTTDEEIGSGDSRALIEREARNSLAVLVFEPSLPGGGLKTSRKGVGRFVMDVRGVSAHAGIDPGAGVSAITELAHQVLEVERFADPAAGTTINVGIVEGGTRENVVAEHARAVVDVRVATAAEADRISRAFAALAPVTTGARVAARGGFNRPPMERGPGVAALVRLAVEAAADLDLALAEGATGGASDGNFTAALGVPTLDGLGPVGDGAHARHEHLELASLVPRAALAACLIGRILAAAGPSAPRPA